MSCRSQVCSASKEPISTCRHKCTPFKAVFGADPEVKLEANVVPKELDLLLTVASLTTRNLLANTTEEDDEFESAESDPNEECLDKSPSEPLCEQPINTSQSSVERSDKSSLNFSMEQSINITGLKRKNKKKLATESSESSNEDEIISKTYRTRQREANEAIIDRRQEEEGQSRNSTGDKETENNLNCCVCDFECGRAHQCNVCKQFVHAI